MKIQKKFYYLELFLVLGVLTDAYGLRNEDWGGWGLIQLLCFGYLGIYLIFILIRSISRKIYIWIVTFISIFLFSMLTGFLSTEGNWNYYDVVENTLKIKLILSVPFFIHQHRKLGDRLFFKATSYIGIFCVFVNFLIILNQFNSSVSFISFSTAVGSEFRFITPTGTLIALSYFYFLSIIAVRYDPKTLLFCILALLGLVAQMHRSILFSIAVCTLLIFILTARISFKKLLKGFLSIIILLLPMYFMTNYFGYTSEMWINNLNFALSEIDNNDGNFGIRINLIINSLIYTLSNLKLFGIGFIYWEDYDFDLYKYYSFAFGPSLDSSYSSIIMVYGPVGFLSFIVLILSMMFYFSRSYDNNSFHTKMDGLSRFKNVLLFYLLLTGVASDNFFRYTATVTFYILVGAYLSFSVKPSSLIQLIKGNR